MEGEEVEELNLSPHSVTNFTGKRRHESVQS